MTGPGADGVAVVTVNWNGWRDSVACWQSLQRTTGAEWHFFLVDNASSDDSLTHLRQLGPGVTLIESPVNGGWTGGNNLAIREAIAAGYQWIFILNNDARVEPGTIRALLDAHRAAGGHCATGPVHLQDDGESYDFLGTLIEAETGFPFWLPPSGAYAESMSEAAETSTIKGAGLFVDRETFERVGYFDPRFYLNYDETDWCYRAHALGIPLYMIKSARILHSGSKSIGGLDSPLQVYFMTRNALLFGERHCTTPQRLRHAHNLYWEGRLRARAHQPPARTLIDFLRSTVPVDRAFRLGVRDYVLRRFGDCPPLIRQLNREGRRS